MHPREALGHGLAELCKSAWGVRTMDVLRVPTGPANPSHGEGGEDTGFGITAGLYSEVVMKEVLRGDWSL